MNFLFAIAGFICALGPLILFHELGHYLVAKACNVHVLRFSIGFGRPLLKRTFGKDRTEWALSAIPLGGFVAMLESAHAEPGAYTAQQLARAFDRQSVWRRIAIVAAGPIANFVLAVVLFWGIAVHGVEEPRAVIGAPPLHSLAANAGLREGDLIERIGDQPVASFVDLRWSLLRDAMDERHAIMDVSGIDGTHRRIDLDLSGIGGKAFEGEVLQQVGLSALVPSPALTRIASGGAAQAAGLMAGDRIVGIDGTPVRTAEQLRGTIRHSAGKTLHALVARQGQTVPIDVTPVSVPDPEHPGNQMGAIGVELGNRLSMVTVRYGLWDGLRRGAAQTTDMATATWRMVEKMASGTVSVKTLSGPVTIADYAGQTVRMGWVTFLSFMAFVSVSIGFMNLLPIPMLDGGHLLYYLAEIILRRPLPERVLHWSQRAGIAVLAGLMSVALFNDLTRLLS